MHYTSLCVSLNKWLMDDANSGVSQESADHTWDYSDSSRRSVLPCSLCGRTPLPGKHEVKC